LKDRGERSRIAGVEGGRYKEEGQKRRKVGGMEEGGGVEEKKDGINKGRKT